MTSDYVLLDIPSSLTSSSLKGLVPYSSAPASQPRNAPEPKNKEKTWPQAEELKKLHEQYGTIVEEALRAAQDAEVKEWCKPRIEKSEEKEAEQDIRQWQEMFQIMDRYGHPDEPETIELSKGLVDIEIRLL